jgi:hypothetical protein
VVVYLETETKTELLTADARNVMLTLQATEWREGLEPVETEMDNVMHKITRE